jgi:predicted transcriptional regulator
MLRARKKRDYNKANASWYYYKARRRGKKKKGILFPFLYYNLTMDFDCINKDLGVIGIRLSL